MTKLLEVSFAKIQHFDLNKEHDKTTDYTTCKVAGSISKPDRLK